MITAVKPIWGGTEAVYWFFSDTDAMLQRSADKSVHIYFGLHKHNSESEAK